MDFPSPPDGSDVALIHPASGNRYILHAVRTQTEQISQEETGYSTVLVYRLSPELSDEEFRITDSNASNPYPWEEIPAAFLISEHPEQEGDKIVCSLPCTDPEEPVRWRIRFRLPAQPDTECMLAGDSD